MAGLNTTLDIAKNTLLTSQALVSISSNNISNADNASYARQTGVVTTNPSYRSNSVLLGMGSSLDKVTQSRDQLIERQLHKSLSQESEYTTLYNRLDQVASVLEDDGESGLSTVLGEFWDAWDTLNQNDGTSERIGVYEAASNLAQSITDLHDNLTDLVDSFTSEISDTVDSVNGLLQKISDYNDQIVHMESSGTTANDLRDLRYQALSDLSDIVSFSYNEEDNGAITIKMGDETLVDGSPPSVSKLKFEQDNNESTFTISVAGGGEVASYTDAFPYTTVIGDHEVQYQEDFSGSLKGMLEALADTSSYIDMLDSFKANLVSEVNAAYSGSKNPAENVFSTDSGYITVDSGFTQDSIDAATALDVSDVQGTGLDALGGSTLGDYLSAIQEQFGTDQSYASSQSEFKTSLREELESQQQSVSGVSIDEETVNILKYQQMYQAASKLVSITSEMMDTLIQMV